MAKNVTWIQQIKDMVLISNHTLIPKYNSLITEREYLQLWYPRFIFTPITSNVESEIIYSRHGCQMHDLSGMKIPQPINFN